MLFDSQNKKRTAHFQIYFIWLKKFITNWWIYFIFRISLWLNSQKPSRFFKWESEKWFGSFLLFWKTHSIRWKWWFCWFELTGLIKSPQIRALIGHRLLAWLYGLFKMFQVCCWFDTFSWNKTHHALWLFFWWEDPHNSALLFFLREHVALFGRFVGNLNYRFFNSSIVIKIWIGKIELSEGGIFWQSNE